MDRLAAAVVVVMVTAASVGIVLVSCGKPHVEDASRAGSHNLFADPVDSAGPRAEAPPPKFELDARGKELLSRATEGDEPDVMRFSSYVGAAGLIELSREPGTRRLALTAMAYSPSLSCVDILADVAKDGNEEDATAALESLRLVAARARVADDLEDFTELASACDTLLGLARDQEPGRADRARRATSVLRMLQDRGCDASVEMR